MTNNKKCGCHQVANFRAETCKHCGAIYNGNEPMQALKHFKECEEGRKAREKWAKDFLKSLTPKQLASFKNLGKKK